jgi:flagellar protein FliS
MTSPALRSRYLNDTVSTASPTRLLVMLYDRLVLDLARAEEALLAGDREPGSRHLLHAQEIVMELHSSLDVTTWSGAVGLSQLYTFLTTELIGANIRADTVRTATIRQLVEPLRDAWHEATRIGTSEVIPRVA